METKIKEEQKLNFFAKPIEASKTFSLDEKDIEQTYTGQLNCCACGCAGNYYKMDKNPKAVRRAINLLKKTNMITTSNGEPMGLKFQEWNEKDGHCVCIEIETSHNRDTAYNRSAEIVRGTRIYFKIKK